MGRLLRVCSFLAVLVAAPSALAQPLFTSTSSPTEIAPGGVAAFTFTITNAGGPVSDLAFTDTLPAGVTIATSLASTDCEGTLTAPSGGGTITFTGGRVGAGATCTVVVYVTSSTVGTAMNVSGDLTSTAGNSGTANNDLTVATDRPSFTLSAGPNVVPWQGRSTLTYTIDNTLNPALAIVTANQTLPGGFTLASPTGLSTDCAGATVAADAGGDTIAISNALVNAGATCTVTVDVVAGAVGDFDLLSDIATGRTQTFMTNELGRAWTGISVVRADLQGAVVVVDDPVNAGATATLEFTIQNGDRNQAATNLAVTLDLDAALSGLVAAGLPANDVCGAGSQISGTSLLSLTGGSLPASGSCTFEVTVQLPVVAPPGTYDLVPSQPTADVGGAGVMGQLASGRLFVTAAPLLALDILETAATGGDQITAEISLTDLSTTGATNIAFVLPTTEFVPGATVTLPTAGFCNGTGSATLGQVDGTLDNFGVFVTGASLATGASCTFNVLIDLPASVVPGSATLEARDGTASADGTSGTIAPASDSVLFAVAPSLDIEFIDGPVAPGDTTTLRFTVTNLGEGQPDATDIAFSLDTTMLGGATVSMLPVGEPCGSGSMITETMGVLDVVGGSLTAGGSCSFDVVFDVPAAAMPGGYTTTSSTVTATVGGAAVTQRPASAELDVAGLRFALEFLGDPVPPGGEVTARFTIENVHPTNDATSVFFTTNFGSPSGGALGAVTSDTCGGTPSPSGTFFLYTGGSVMSGTMCEIELSFTLPLSVTPGLEIGYVTSALTATQGGSVILADAAADTVTITAPLMFALDFTDDPTTPGGAVTAEFTLTNGDMTTPASSLAFAADLDAALTGLAFDSVVFNDCGGSATGAGLLSYSGGSLPAGGSCTLSVSLSVPASAPREVTVDASALSGTTGTSDPVSATFVVDTVTFSKAFDAAVQPGQVATLTFTIENIGTDALSDVRFADDLGAMVAGATTDGAITPLMGNCTDAATIGGGGVFTLTGGALASMERCVFSITVDIPMTAAPGMYANTTSELNVGAAVAHGPAVAMLTLSSPPVPSLTLAFDPTTIFDTETSSLTVTIANSGSAVDATALQFSAVLPAGVSGSVSSNTCGGSATASAGTLSFSGGAVAAGATCTIVLEVSGPTGLQEVDVMTLESSLGTGSGAAATLTINTAPDMGMTGTDMGMAATDMGAAGGDMGSAGVDAGIEPGSLRGGSSCAAAPGAGQPCTIPLLLLAALGLWRRRR